MSPKKGESSPTRAPQQHDGLPRLQPHSQPETEPELRPLPLAQPQSQPALPSGRAAEVSRTTARAGEGEAEGEKEEVAEIGLHQGSETHQNTLEPPALVGEVPAKIDVTAVAIPQNSSVMGLLREGGDTKRLPSLNLQHMLNPTQSEHQPYVPPLPSPQPNRRRKSSHFDDDEPLGAMKAPRLAPDSMGRSPSVHTRMEPFRPPQGIQQTLDAPPAAAVTDISGPPGLPRRILTPRSPTEGASSGGLFQGSIDSQLTNARLSPFLSTRGRIHSQEVGGAPPPSDTAMTSPRYFHQPLHNPALGGRRASTSVLQSSAAAPLSIPASPSPSFGSFSSYTSPAQHFGLPAQQQQQHQYQQQQQQQQQRHQQQQQQQQPALAQSKTSPSSFGAALHPGSGQAVSSNQLHVPPEGIHAAPPGSGTWVGGYQLMTFDTDQGPVQLPVDVQAASKLADEKRRRNAGASARFRQRRKERERESSQSISRLQQTVRELMEEREYYRTERDYFRSVVFAGGMRYNVSRPPSPRIARPRRESVAGMSVSSEDAWHEREESAGLESSSGGRRRASDFPPSFPLPTASTHNPGPSHSIQPMFQGPTTTAYNYLPHQQQQQQPLARSFAQQLEDERTALPPPPLPPNTNTIGIMSMSAPPLPLPHGPPVAGEGGGGGGGGGDGYDAFAPNRYDRNWRPHR